MTSVMDTEYVFLELKKIFGDHREVTRLLGFLEGYIHGLERINGEGAAPIQPFDLRYFCKAVSDLVILIEDKKLNDECVKASLTTIKECLYRMQVPS